VNKERRGLKIILRPGYAIALKYT
jgi:hypothetical protein